MLEGSKAGVNWLDESRLEMRGKKEETTMLKWAALFLVIALVAGLLGFAGVAGAASNIAWIIFVLFLILFVVSLFMGGRSPAA
jgi:uncharacterized membrane protein YtjA (UPF0391 family)